MATCKCCSSYTLPAYIWAILSLVSAVLCPIGLYFSNWLQREVSGSYNSLSSFRLCLNESSQISLTCDSYFTFNEIYTTEWKAVTLLMGMGACCFVFTALLSLFGFCVSKLFNKCITTIVAVFQILGGILFIVGIVVFPAGMDERNIKAICGENSAAFKLGECAIGWAYILIIIGTVIGVVAAMMSWTPARWRKRDTEGSYVL